ncbi:hypothetical protein HQ393_13895 [Chitinibacter bivalviorum]|uniref:Uncharacterized protein n=1 Tax=Chitinibacter bivalviorum TaxID=2739434 RepID=A0A7H9BKP2_9NEIS|nr:hypothetical protein [Chitinibacter bivalviorum]QLG89245.1 hypothetical protein HQ393_13895 [Chitinibacter bivalviorum]
MTRPTWFAPSLATRARPIAAKPRPSSAWQGAAKLAARAWILCGYAASFGARSAAQTGWRLCLHATHSLLAQAVNRPFRRPNEQGAGLAPPLATRARPIDAKPRPSSAWQGAAKLAARA